MNLVTSERFDIEKRPGQFPDDVCLIIGAGYFGRRAATILKEMSASPILIVDRSEDRLVQVSDLPVEKIAGDGVGFLADNFHLLNSSSVIVPAIPVHLAAEWLKQYLDRSGWRVVSKKVPDEILPALPHSWRGLLGTLLVSYSDFYCPDDCPEPSDHCPMTGEKRALPLYELLGRIVIPDHTTHVIRSRQLAPGLGGYKVADLRNLLLKTSQGAGNWLVGTACSCHGALTVLNIQSKRVTGDELLEV